MTEFDLLLDGLSFTEPVSTIQAFEPLGAAWLAEEGRGVQLDRHQYIEQECLFSGLADVWTWDDGWQPIVTRTERFTSRVIARRPADPARFSGRVQIEPLHPDDDQALTWGNIAPWIVAEGHAHVGVTQDPRVVPQLIDFDPARYGKLTIPEPGQRWDIVALAAAAAKDRRLPGFEDLTVDHVVMSGWSNTGTFCRTFLGEGFHDRCRVDGAAVLSGYVICISSGGVSRSGYASLREGFELPLDDPRRVIGAHGVPVVELLSECESETHQACLRDDANGPQDLYRLYQVAGTCHIATGVRSLLTNRYQKHVNGLPAPPREINEQPSSARMDMIARSIYAGVDRWIIDDEAPPSADRFVYADPASEEPRGLMPGAVPLARDPDGNAIGGLRPPWVETPFATYLPHSTPRPGSCDPGPNAPFRDPALMADLIGHMRLMSTGQLQNRYGTAHAYLEQFEEAAQNAVDDGYLREADLTELVELTRRSCGEW